MMKLMKLRSKKFLTRSNSSCNKIENAVNGNNSSSPTAGASSTSVGGGQEIKWEVRPGGMLVQKRECEENAAGSSNSSSDGCGEGTITLRVSTVSNCHHHVSIQSTSTFGELKLMLSMVTSLEPKEQRLLYRGKEREDYEYLHMAGVRENDKVVVLEDPAVKERKLMMMVVGMGMGGGLSGEVVMASPPCRTISV